MPEDGIEPCFHPTVVPWSDPLQCGVCGRLFIDRDARFLQQSYARMESAAKQGDGIGGQQAGGRNA